MSVKNAEDKKTTLRARFGGVAATLLFHGALLGLFIYFGFKPPEPPITKLEETGVEVSMGEENAGGPNLNASPDAASLPAESSETNVLTDENGEPLENASDQPTTNTTTPERQADPNALLPKNLNSNNGGSGIGETPGNQGGIGNGTDPLGRGYGIIGPGTEGALRGRNIEYTPEIINTTNEDGTLKIRLYVDREGKVTKAVAQAQGSTISNPQLIYSTQVSLLKRKYSANPDGPEIQEAYITINFKQK